MIDGISPTMLERLQGLIDESDIRTQLVRFGRYLDEKDWDGYASLYALDGVIELPHGRHEGREGLADWVSADLGRYVATQHITASHDIEVDGDEATARTTLFGVHVVSSTDGGPDGQSYWAGGGHYDTRLRRTEDGWQFTLVRPQPVWFFDTGGANPHVAPPA